MRRLIVVVVSIALLAPIPALAIDERDEMTAVLASLALVDYRQTVEAINDRTGYVERNPLLGERPSRGDLLAFGAASLALAYAVSWALPPELSRPLMRSVVASEAANVELNRTVLDGGRRDIVIPIILSFEW